MYYQMNLAGKHGASGSRRQSERSSNAPQRSTGPRRDFRSSRPSRGGGRARGRGPKEASFDFSKFVNKSVEGEVEERFVPEHSFESLPVAEGLKLSIAAKGYTMPTPIQDKAIPHVLSGRDVVGLANTGTGKTAAFLIPLIDKVLRNQKEQVLIIVPTRELALQIDEEFKGFAAKLRLFSVCCVGGAPMGPQLRALSYKNHFIIGTPGRLKDFVERGKIRLGEFSTIVLDEADRMLDMGFIDDMRFVMEHMPKPRHTLFFSATLSREIEKLIAQFLDNPIVVKVATRDTAKNVEQDVVHVGRNDRAETLLELLKSPEFSRVLVFGRTKHGVEKLSRFLFSKGVRADSIHGDKTHRERQRALRRFKEGEAQVLVATDVAARGLDISDVSHVINFDLPGSYEDYIHRIGRTGRGEKRGKALTFVE